MKVRPFLIVSFQPSRLLIEVETPACLLAFHVSWVFHNWINAVDHAACMLSVHLYTLCNLVGQPRVRLIVIQLAPDTT